MPHLDFYLDEKDKLDLMSIVFSKGGTLIPALQYEQPDFTLVQSIDEYISYVNRSVLLFIVHSSYFKESLSWGTTNKDGKELFYIIQRVGGPTINFYSPGIIDREGIRLIGQGSISYHTSYQSLLQKSNMGAPQAQKMFYKEILREIKKGFAIKLAKRTYWVGCKTFENLRNGSKLMNVGDDILNDFLKFAQ